MQLVAYGAQDVFLTGDPEVTYFKNVVRRHTNFAMETLEVTLNGNPNFGRKSTLMFPRVGDLVSRLYVMVKLPSVSLNTAWNDSRGIPQFAWVRKIGHAIIDEVECNIGGTKMDKHYGISIDMIYELSKSASQERGYSAMIGDVPQVTRLDTVRGDNQTLKDSYTLYIPMQFWFNSVTSSALPLVSLQYHDTKMDITFASLEKITCRSKNLSLRDLNFSSSDFILLANYIYLEPSERNMFAMNHHEYLIEQLQYTGTESANSESARLKLGFSHPTKFLMWSTVNGQYNNSNSFLAYTHEQNWTNALEYAAESVGLGMVRVDLDVGPLADTTDNFVKVGSIDQVVTVTMAGGHNITVNLLVPAVFQDIAANQLAVYLRNNVLNSSESGYTTYNLGNKIGSMTVVVGSSTVSGVNLIWPVNVVVQSHSFSVRDISHPLTDFVDNRENPTAPVPGLTNLLSLDPTQRDIVVNLFGKYGVLIDGSINPVYSAQLQLNGQDRFPIREGNYFNYVQPYQHFNSTPADGINVYSFAFHPLQFQPSGSVNLSRIDTTQLNINYLSAKQLNDATNITAGTVSNVPPVHFLNSDSKLHVFDRNINIFRAITGLGGLAYAN